MSVGQGLVASIGHTTVWRWLDEDAIRPWHHRTWIFPRDPDFARKAGRILDLYHKLWKGQPLKNDEFVLCADEKTSIQARARPHPTEPPQTGSPMKVEHEYRRLGRSYCQALRSMRERHRHRPLLSADRSGHAPSPLPRCSTHLLDCR